MDTVKRAFCFVTLAWQLAMASPSPIRCAKYLEAFISRAFINYQSTLQRVSRFSASFNDNGTYNKCSFFFALAVRLNELETQSLATVVSQP